MDILKAMIDAIANRYATIVIFAVNLKEDGSVSFICRNNNPNVHAGYLVKQAATLSGGNGGGSSTFAQGGGKNSLHLEQIQQMVRNELQND